ncbi:hypothetical protein OH77DRAFT_9866 [Trametes cingulata]|nr:hypothetical protein OH77DRAFT_9866 [Trametes cingulata]
MSCMMRPDSNASRSTIRIVVDEKSYTQRAPESEPGAWSVAAPPKEGCPGIDAAVCCTGVVVLQCTIRPSHPVPQQACKDTGARGFPVVVFITRGRDAIRRISARCNKREIRYVCTAQACVEPRKASRSYAPRTDIIRERPQEASRTPQPRIDERAPEQSPS